ncbi:hypothetical protein ABIC22_004982 [Paenibacillus sp. PvP094]
MNRRYYGILSVVMTGSCFNLLVQHPIENR